MQFVTKLREAFRDKMRDEFCAGLQHQLGISASLAPRGRPAERVKRDNRGSSLGLIDISEGPIRWVNVQEFGRAYDTFYCATYGVPDPKIGPIFPKASIKSVRVRSRRVFGDVIRVDWEGKDLGLGVIGRLVEQPWEALMRSAVDIEIIAHPEYGCWAMSPLGDWRRNEFMHDQGIWGGLPSAL